MASGGQRAELWWKHPPWCGDRTPTKHKTLISTFSGDRDRVGCNYAIPTAHSLSQNILTRPSSTYLGRALLFVPMFLPLGTWGIWTTCRVSHLWRIRKEKGRDKLKCGIICRGTSCSPSSTCPPFSLTSTHDDVQSSGSKDICVLNPSCISHVHSMIASSPALHKPTW